jgi:hypothetical protein
LKSCLATTQRVQELWIKMTSFTGGTILHSLLALPCKGETTELRSFYLVPHLEECSPSVVLVKTVSSCFQNFMEHFPFSTSVSSMLWDIHGTFNLFYVLLVL